MELARRKCGEVRGVLLSRQQFIYPQPTQRPGQVPVCEAYFDGPYAVGVLGGEWRLHGRWRYWSDPSSGAPTLQESSVGVSVVSGGPPELAQPVCVARYDVELHGARRGRHINVLQPVVRDKVHWLYLDAATQFDDWSFERVLSFLISELPDELLRAGWPSA
jgi:hypothetical protein